ncbi:MAG: methylmalonyl Co-A mutase-associated GTPase MeaB [Nannocystaceae bacterium]
MARRTRPTAQQLIDGVTAGDRAVLARAITLAESQRDEDRALVQDALSSLYERTGKSHRVGITGVPGVGKSSFIETFGSMLTREGHRVAVLAVDPSSARSGGSILGDKTRMQRLARDPNAFIRPSPSSGTLGGVARHTREAMLLCEAAGFDIIVVETVGVGQSEAMVARIVDSFLVLMLSGAGDELQGIKRGILELADVLAVNKADGDNLEPARRARLDLRAAFIYMLEKTPGWKVPVLTCSAHTGEGIEEVWQALQAHRQHLRKTGAWEQDRQKQRVYWFWRTVEAQLAAAFRADPNVAQATSSIEEGVRTGALSPERAAEQLLAHYRR